MPDLVVRAARLRDGRVVDLGVDGDRIVAIHELGVPVALGQDDIEDAYYPFGRHSMWEVAFLCAHSLGWLSGPQQQRLLDLVTTRAADVLAITDHRLAVGNRADLPQETAR